MSTATIPGDDLTGPSSRPEAPAGFQPYVPDKAEICPS